MPSAPSRTERRTAPDGESEPVPGQSPRRPRDRPVRYDIQPLPPAPPLKTCAIRVADVEIRAPSQPAPNVSQNCDGAFDSFAVDHSTVDSVAAPRIDRREMSVRQIFRDAHNIPGKSRCLPHSQGQRPHLAPDTTCPNGAVEKWTHGHRKVVARHMRGHRCQHGRRTAVENPGGRADVMGNHVRGERSIDYRGGEVRQAAPGNFDDWGGNLHLPGDKGVVADSEIRACRDSSLSGRLI